MQVAPLQNASSDNLYEAVADRVAWLIENETLRPGDRIPSVRKMRGQMGVSISTVMQAYRLLEHRGLVEARPQSGYYVRRSVRRTLAEPTAARPKNSPRKVNIASLSYSLLEKLNNPAFIKLGAAVSDIEEMPVTALNRMMGRVLRNHPNASHAYDGPSGCERLRIEIARRMLDAGVAVGPEEIVTTCGAAEALYLALLSVTEPGDTVAIETPTYYGILEKLESLHLKSFEMPTDPRNGIDVAAVEQAMSEGRIQAVVTVPNFSNPLGSLMPEENKKALAEIGARWGIPIIEDDIHGELFFEGRRPRAVKAFDPDDDIIYCSSFSKTLSPGCRAGWCIPGRFTEAVIRRKLAITQSSPTPTQMAVAAYLRSGAFDRHLRRIRKFYRTQVDCVTRAVGRYFPEGTRASNPQGGHVLWVEMPEEVDSLRLHDEAAQRGISVAPGPLFSPIGHYRNCVRLNCGIAWTPEVEEAVKVLGEMAKGYV